MLLQALEAEVFQEERIVGFRQLMRAPLSRWLPRLLGTAFALMPVYPPVAAAVTDTVATVTSQCARPAHDPSLPPAQPVPVHRYEVVARYPHDSEAFTQGLTFHGGDLYESTGLYGHSEIRRVDLASGATLTQQRLPEQYFGEGLATVDGRLVQLTWRAGVAFVYDPVDLHKVGEFPFAGEGWGSTDFEGALVISDGSSRLRFLDPRDYRETGAVQVTAQERPVTGLNELETVRGLIFANVYPGDCIAMIDPGSGHVAGWLDLGGLMPLSERRDGTAVANGIAYNAQTGKLFVTGKYWPFMFQLRLPGNGYHHDRRAFIASDPTGCAQ